MAGGPQVARAEAVVRAGWVLTSGPAGAIRDGAVHVRDGAIVAVGPWAEVGGSVRDGVPVVGDEHGILIPGLVNTHTHLSEALVTGMGSELTLWEWGTRIVTPVGRVLTTADAREGTVLKAVELLHAGVTCVNDMFVHANPDEPASLGVVEGLDAVGLRGIVSFGAEDAMPEVADFAARGVGAVIAEQQALAAAAEDAELLGFRYGIGTLLGQTDALLEAGVAACAAHGWGVHTHLCEVREEVVEASLRWGRRPLAHAAHLGLLDRPLVVGHAIWLTEPDVATMAEAGVAVAHNPVANMILGSGVCDVPRLRSAGIAVGIGTDGAASNDSQNMLEAVKAAALLQKVHHVDPSVIDAADVLAMATIDGARALGLDHLVGSLEVGKRADLVRLGDTVELANVHDPYQQLVYATSPRSVRDVWVDGRRLLADGVVTVVEEAAQIARCRPLARRLAVDAGLVAAGESLL